MIVKFYSSGRVNQWVLTMRRRVTHLGPVALQSLQDQKESVRRDAREEDEEGFKSSVVAEQQHNDMEGTEQK
jgi:hypothetical protein